MPKSFKAIGFDLGDTLVHYEGLPLSWHRLYAQALARVAAVCGLTITDADISAGETVLTRYNTRLNPRLQEVTADLVLREVLAAWGAPVAADMAAVEDAFFGFFQQSYAVFSDTPMALHGLRDLGVPMGILSDAPYGMPNRFIEQDLAPIAEYFAAVITSVDVGYRKPHALGFIALAERLDVDPGEMVYVGNEEKDIRGAVSAGMEAILIDRVRRTHPSIRNRGGAGPEFGQHRTVASLEELIGYWARNTAGPF